VQFFASKTSVFGKLSDFQVARVKSRGSLNRSLPSEFAWPADALDPRSIFVMADAVSRLIRKPIRKMIASNKRASHADLSPRKCHTIGRESALCTALASSAPAWPVNLARPTSAVTRLVS
jgi:hypothetical protein